MIVHKSSLKVIKMSMIKQRTVKVTKLINEK